jgi:hypothetical protein
MINFKSRELFAVSSRLSRDRLPIHDSSLTTHNPDGERVPQFLQPFYSYRILYLLNQMNLAGTSFVL